MILTEECCTTLTILKDIEHEIWLIVVPCVGLIRKIAIVLDS